MTRIYIHHCNTSLFFSSAKSSKPSPKINTVPYDLPNSRSPSPHRVKKHRKPQKKRPNSPKPKSKVNSNLALYLVQKSLSEFYQQLFKIAIILENVLFFTKYFILSNRKIKIIVRQIVIEAECSNKLFSD